MYNIPETPSLNRKRGSSDYEDFNGDFDKLNSLANPQLKELPITPTPKRTRIH